jgi:hypothetical protein
MARSMAGRSMITLTKENDINPLGEKGESLSYIICH